MAFNDETEPARETSGLFSASGRDGRAELGLVFVVPQARVPLVPSEDLPLLLGRDGQGDARLDGPELSRRHAELARRGGALVITDLDSRNGIYVNGARAREAVLRRHDIVRLGAWLAIVVDAAVATQGQELAVADIPPLFGEAGKLHLGPATRRLAGPAHRLAATTISIVLEGETGTGKERFAAAIHAWSGRKGPLVAINCAAIPEALAEAELFGHREGAFTGASRASPGHFRAAHGGTLFLDEVTDMPLGVQAKLLRALEQKEVLPIGESRPVPVDVRVIAATQVPLEQAVAQKRMRADLHARLDGFCLRIPPLRERREDIPSLFAHLLVRRGFGAAAMSPRFYEALCRYPWPLNVRELDFLAARLAALHPGEPLLRRSHLPERIRQFSGWPAAPETAPVVGAPSRVDLLAALGRAGGNLAQAAAALGISRPKAYRLLGRESPQRWKTARRP